MDLDLFTIYEKIKSFYSEQLFIWGLSSQRLCVLKASSYQESQRDQEEHDNLKVAKSQTYFFQFCSILNFLAQITQKIGHKKIAPKNYSKNASENTQKIAPEKPNKVTVQKCYDLYKVPIRPA